MREDLIERLRREAAAWDDWNEDHPDDAAVTTLPLLREAAAALEALRAERDLFRDETIELVRQNGEWQTRAERLAEVIRAYKSECDNPAKDYVMRAKRRDEMFAALNHAAAQENDDNTQSGETP